MADIIQGQTKRIEFETFNLDDVLTDPSVTKFIYKYGDTKVTLVFGTDLALVRDSVGMFHVDLTFSVSGWWKWRIELTGAVTNAGQGKIYVAPALL